jgi:hypothetical protein
MRILSRFFVGVIAIPAVTCGLASAVCAVEIPKPVINIPKPNIPRPTINVPRPHVTVNVPKPAINVPRPAVAVPKVAVVKPTVSVPKVAVSKPVSGAPTMNFKPVTTANAKQPAISEKTAASGKQTTALAKSDSATREVPTKQNLGRAKGKNVASPSSTEGATAVNEGSSSGATIICETDLCAGKPKGGTAIAPGGGTIAAPAKSDCTASAPCTLPPDFKIAGSCPTGGCPYYYDNQKIVYLPPSTSSPSPTPGTVNTWQPSQTVTVNGQTMSRDQFISGRVDNSVVGNMILGGAIGWSVGAVTGVANWAGAGASVGNAAADNEQNSVAPTAAGQAASIGLEGTKEAFKTNAGIDAGLAVDAIPYVGPYISGPVAKGASYLAGAGFDAAVEKGTETGVKAIMSPTAEQQPPASEQQPQSPAVPVGSPTVATSSGTDNPNGSSDPPTVNVPYSLAANPNPVSPMLSANAPSPAPASALTAITTPNAPASAVNALMMPPKPPAPSANSSPPDNVSAPTLSRP